MKQKYNSKYNPDPDPESGVKSWLKSAQWHRDRAAKAYNPLERVWEMLDALKCELYNAEGVKRFVGNPDGSPWFDDPKRNAENLAYYELLKIDAEIFATKYPNGKPLAELNAELKAYLTELIQKL